MRQQLTCVRPLLLLILGFLMLYDNQATPVEKRAQAAGDVTNKLIYDAVKNLKFKVDTLVESVDKSSRKSKVETEKLEEKVQQLNERLENKTEQINERIETEVNELGANVSSKLDTMDKKLLSGFYTDFYVSSEYKGKIYLLSKVLKKFDIDRDERRCELLGGYLIELDDVDEVRFVSNFVNNTVGTVYYFTGNNDNMEEGNWVHKYSGNSLKYLKWGRNEPDNNGNCVVVNIKAKIWETRCDNTYHIVCEVPTGSVS